MYKIILFIIIGLCAGISGHTQSGKPLRIVDSVPAKASVEQYRILLRSELDSLVGLYAPLQTPVQLQPKETMAKNRTDAYILAGIIVLVLMSVPMLFILYRQRKALEKFQVKTPVQPVARNGKMKNGKKPPVMLSPEVRIEELQAELHKLSKENENLGRVISEYNGIQHEYDSLKHGMQKAYKVRNYPGNDKSKNDSNAMQSVLETEEALACYAYEKFLKPVLAITDAHKNNPPKMNAADREKLMDLLLSLSFLYIEYLYLRVADLSVGGHIVERIKAFTQGDPPDPRLLKKLNTESGSRALVMRMVLNKALVNDLSYPVFDETNLNR